MSIFGGGKDEEEEEREKEVKELHLLIFIELDYLRFYLNYQKLRRGGDS